MSVVETSRRMTTDELLAMPDDGVERWLIRGELRENTETDMNRRNPDHARTCSNITAFLKIWLMKQPKPRGSVYVGDTMFKLRTDRESTLGIDVAYVSPELEARTPRRSRLVDGPPVLAVEVLSPSDKVSDITEKVNEYLASGVAIVWIVNPDFELVTVCRCDSHPVAFDRLEELTAEPELPGFRVRVAELFE